MSEDGSGWAQAATGLLNFGAGFYYDHRAAQAAGASNKRDALLWQAQVNWEREKMQNAVQWRMQDMKKAGINPMLASRDTNSASSPSFGGSTTANLGAGMSGVNSAVEGIIKLRQMEQDKELTEARIQNETKQAEAEKEKKEAETLTLMKQYGLIDKKFAQEIAESKARISKLEADRTNTAEQTKATRGGLGTKFVGTGTTEEAGKAYDKLNKAYDYIIDNVANSVQYLFDKKRKVKLY